MKSVIETARGLSACAMWLLGTPLVNARVAVGARNKQDARAIYARHCQRFLDTCHIKVELDGEPPPSGRGCVLCHNESSFPDLMAYMVTVLNHVDRVAAAELYRYFPFARGAFARIDFEMVRRGNRAATDELISKVIERVREGERVAWGGEGGLSGTDGIRRFKIGASLIAIRAGVPVVPIAIHGGHHTMPMRSVRARSGTIRIRFGNPIATMGLNEEDARDLADRLHSCVSGMYSDLAKRTSTCVFGPDGQMPDKAE
jgi:1-acyl-sn-glycerol-3-phosphate acyltransferase